jgi:glycosyltransferase involved in cell wall biosynthesis
MPSSSPSDLSIAVLVPCYNEEATVARVVEEFRVALPSATIYVCDNRSTDRTYEVAKAAGAVVSRESRPGKGEVVRRMFADIEADVYLMVDGDATYHAPSAQTLIDAMCDTGADLVNGARVDTSVKAYRFGHRFGNRLLTGLVAAVFGQMTTDMLSGFKVFSRRYVKSFPAHSRGFEIETELMVHALELRMGIAELPTPYAERPEGSVSKLNTIRDGIRILSIIGLFVKEERPLQVFAGVSALLALVALGLGLPVVAEFMQTGLVARFPTAILASALMVTAVMSLFSGLVLDTVTRGRREAKRFAYLAARDRRFAP